MIAALQALLDPRGLKPLRILGLRWVYFLAAMVQVLNFALFGWALPEMQVPDRALLVLAGVGLVGIVLLELLKSHQLKSGRPIALVQAAMLDGLALGLAVLLAAFAWRMGLGLWSLGFVGLGLSWYLAGFIRLTFRI